MRKSIRHYSNKDVGDNVRAALDSWRDWVYMYANGDDAECDIKIMDDSSQLGGLYFIKAPLYIVYWGRATRSGRINAGFVLEQISLRLTALGVGTCYLGATHVNGAKATERGLEPLIVMSMGVPSEPLTRGDISEFKRKSMDEICADTPCGNAAAVMESARIAPSAMNRQPWRMVIDGKRIICCVENSLLDVYRHLSEIDMGIVMSHMLLTARTRSDGAHIECVPSDATKAPKGSEYVATLIM